MIAMTLSQIAAVTGGRVSPPEAASVLVDGPVVTDSRQAGPGSLYVARVGEHADGHDYVAAAAQAGAVAALTSRVTADLPCVVAADVQAAFAALAGAVAAQVEGLKVVGITGSSGKTTTKDLLAAVLSAHGPTVANVGSLNSEVGVPLTACRVVGGTRHLILEMGSRGVGHIRYLTEIVRPDVAVVLNVGSAHVGQFGDLAVTAAAKGELVEALGPDGVAVLNADDPLVAAMAGRTRGRVVFTGRGPGAQVRAERCRLVAGCGQFTLVTERGEAPVRLRVLGDHQIDNALAVAAAAMALGMEVAQIAQALSSAEVTSRFRMEVRRRPDGVTVLNDAYNANPDSTAAALRTLIELGRGPAPGRTWAVLGPMLELGEASAAAHHEVGRLAAAVGVDCLVAVGAQAREVHRGACEGPRQPGRCVWVADGEVAWQLLSQELTEGDVVLVKSSNSVGLWSLGERLAGQGSSA